MQRLQRFFGLDGPVPRWMAFLVRATPRPDEVRLVCLVLLLGFAAVGAGSWITAFLNGRTLDGRPAGADFIAFYNGGRILNEFGGERLYDLPLQDRMYREAHPWDHDKTMWYVNAPFLAQAFRPLALLPYSVACIVWSVLSAAFYAAAVALIWPRELPHRFLAAPVLAVASFPPFALDAWLGGQLPPLTALVLAAAFRLYRDRHFAWSGAVLALSLYKPTIALPLVAFLFFAAEFRVVAGYVCGAVALAIVSLASVGVAGLRAFVDILKMYSRFTSGGPTPLSVDYKCVDLNHLVRSLMGGNASIATPVFFVLAAGAFLFVTMHWRKVKSGGGGEAMWAVGITATLLLNLYVPLYDATLLAVSALITAGAILKMPSPGVRPAFLALLMLLYVGGLFASPLGRLAGIQPYTVIIAIFGAFQLVVARAASRISACEQVAAAG
ncbi:MAG TPA: glycosyltransferase family 87 protein [Bryobacteraceae bacterium]|nr:glycosyltransferase family 87 protein [Bryobacteraceae bacterium]